MKKALVGIGVVFGVLLIGAIAIFLMVIGIRNRLVILEENVDNQWAQVEVQYQRRYELIPNLVEAVKGTLEQEREVFGDIADARTRYAESPEGSQERVNAANDLESSLGRLLVIVEDYPELKSNETVQNLMTQLEGTENRIAVERRRYNDEVTKFNKKIRVFPNNVINNLFLSFEEKERFEAVENADVAPDVDLSVDDDAPDNAGEGNSNGEGDNGDAQVNDEDTQGENTEETQD
jgi:LemA protein